MEKKTFRLARDSHTVGSVFLFMEFPQRWPHFLPVSLHFLTSGWFHADHLHTQQCFHHFRANLSEGLTVTVRFTLPEGSGPQGDCVPIKQWNRNSHTPTDMFSFINGLCVQASTQAETNQLGSRDFLFSWESGSRVRWWHTTKDVYFSSKHASGSANRWVADYPSCHIQVTNVMNTQKMSQLYPVV